MIVVDDLRKSQVVDMKYRAIPLAMACGLLACAATSLAREPQRSSAPPSRAAQGRTLSLEQAVKQVQRQTHGHILAADTIQRGQSKVYRIKVLTPQGQIRVMQLDSESRSSARSGNPGSDQGGH